MLLASAVSVVSLGAWKLASDMRIRSFLSSYETYLHRSCRKLEASQALDDPTVRAYFCDHQPYLQADVQRPAEWRAYSDQERFSRKAEFSVPPPALPGWVLGKPKAEAQAASSFRSRLGLSNDFVGFDNPNLLHQRLARLLSHRLIREYIQDCVTYADPGSPTLARQQLEAKYRLKKEAKALSLTQNLVFEANSTWPIRRHSHVVRSVKEDSGNLIIDGMWFHG